MTTTTGVFLPDEREHQITKKPPQSVRVNGEEVKRVDPTKADHADPAKLNEQELKAAIIAAWKKHEALAKADLAPLLYWLREQLRAQGARNDLTHDKDRGWEVWVTEHLDISRRTADRWCAWYAEKKSAAEKRGDAQAIAVVQGDVHLARAQPVIPHTQWNGRNRPTRNFAVTANGSRGGSGFAQTHFNRRNRMKLSSW